MMRGGSPQSGIWGRRRTEEGLYKRNSVALCQLSKFVLAHGTFCGFDGTVDDKFSQRAALNPSRPLAERFCLTTDARFQALASCRRPRSGFSSWHSGPSILTTKLYRGSTTTYHSVRQIAVHLKAKSKTGYLGGKALFFSQSRYGIFTSGVNKATALDAAFPQEKPRFPEPDCAE
jgi:hypothetical protein